MMRRARSHTAAGVLLFALPAVLAAPAWTAASPDRAGERGHVPSAPPRRGALTGVVIYPGGRPARDVAIVAYARDPAHRPRGPRRQRVSAMAVTGRDGGFLLWRLRPGEYDVFLLNEVEDGWLAEAQDRVRVIAGQAITLPEFVLTRVAVITGTVVDEKTGAPVAGIRVIDDGPHRPRSWRSFSAPRTDRAGRFVARVAPGRNRVYVAAAFPHGLPSARQDPARVRTMAEFYLREGERRSTVLWVDANRLLTVTIAGRVLRPDGAPARAVSVQAIGMLSASDPRERWRIARSLPSRSPGFGRSRAADVTRPDGSYRLSGLAPGRYTLAFTAKETMWAPASLIREAIQEGTAVRIPTLRLQPGARLVGRVVDGQTGGPIPGARVFIRLPPRQISPPPVAANAPRGFGGSPTGSEAVAGFFGPVIADTQGRFHISVPPGTLSLRVQAPVVGAMARGPVKSITATVKQGETRRLTLRADSGGQR